MELDNMTYAGNVIQEELVSIVCLFMVNTATNESSISHQLVVTNPSSETVIHYI